MSEKIGEPEKYNRNNQLQIQEAKKLINRILHDGTENIKTIVDIGCGSGNVTEMLAKAIPTAKVLAFDCDPGMIQFARAEALAKSLDGQIDYFVEDAGNTWEKLDKKLTLLEGKIDVIFSNFVLHWIPLDKREYVVGTLLRLLKPGGRLYLNITVLLYDSPEFIERMEKLLMNPVPSKEEQRELWERHFSQVQVASPASSFNVVLLHNSWSLKETGAKNENQKGAGAGDIRNLAPELLNMYKLYALSDSVWEKNKEELEKLQSCYVQDAVINGRKIVKGSFVAFYSLIEITGFK